MALHVIRSPQAEAETENESCKSPSGTRTAWPSGRDCIGGINMVGNTTICKEVDNRRKLTGEN